MDTPETEHHRPFVGDDFVIPAPPGTVTFVLAPLEVAHNEADLAAWSSSVDHIHATPGFEHHPWPDEPMTLARNEADLRGHVEDRSMRRGFTYTVLSIPEHAVIGCVYIYPSPSSGVHAHVRSWVVASRHELDAPLYRLVCDWLKAEWPFATVEYAPRPA
ncbi:MAG TPA: hypothetical protein VNG12_20655 [Acidimicrobiales bacterium]|nr:hypothetical protein [Acidimicrobiales bacterium]